QAEDGIRDATVTGVQTCALPILKVWYDVPAYLFAAAIGLAFLFTITRDYPWALVLPTVLGSASVALGIGMIVNPALANAFVSGRSEERRVGKAVRWRGSHVHVGW